MTMKIPASFRLLIIGLSLPLSLTLGCGDSGTDVTASTDLSDCVTQADCAQDSYCYQGTCIATDKLGCANDADCPEGQTCLENGVCKTAGQCTVDADCCEPDEVDCAKACVDQTCVGTECDEGTEQVCYDDCHEGTKTCSQGVWQPCSAAPLGDEVCDGIDNDCNGETDEGCGPCDPPPVNAEEICDDGIDNDCDGSTDEDCEPCEPISSSESVCDDGVDDDCDGDIDDADSDCQPCIPGLEQACNTPCGPGTQTCQDDGVWAACVPETPCDCVLGDSQQNPCGFCGYTEDICDESGQWQIGTECLNEGVCAPDSESSEACGNCGIATKICEGNCTWAPLSDCDETGSQCTPDAVEQEDCGNCGTKSRACGEGCEWSPWTNCVGEGQCTPDDTQTLDCGKCGTRMSTCDGACSWGQYSECTGEGSCYPGDTETQGCGTGKEQSRSCGDDCEWDGWGVCDPIVVCDAGEFPCPDGSGCCAYSDGGCLGIADTHCPGCLCGGCVCAKDPSCCSVQWDFLCSLTCEYECGGCGFHNDGCKTEASTFATSTDCDDGWTYDGTGKCYREFTSTLEWDDARDACEDWGGHLATLNFAGEDSFVSELMSCSAAWIGLHDHDIENTFTWVDGTDLEGSFIHTNWESGEPNDGWLVWGEDCVELNEDGEWNDESCSDNKCYICEKSFEDPVGCAGCTCESCVCDADPFCCNFDWDSQCADTCDTDCGGCGFRGCEGEADAGCDGCPCQECVCADDSYCCDYQWDSTCAASCIQDCGGCGPLPLQ